jgi:hypothetical protein
MREFEKMSEPPVEPSEWQQPFLQLPLFLDPPDEYIRERQEKEEKEETPPRVIIIDL